MNEPTHLDLFSGIGGFSLAFEAQGFKTIGFAEIDPYASAVLKKHWPDVPNFGDVRNVPAIRCDVLTGGFPCQPFSVAGKRRGKADDRHLWPAMCAVIERCKPTFVLGENVPGIINMELDACISDLEAIGYTVQSFTVPACAVDARHRRDRLWIVGYANRFLNGAPGAGKMERSSAVEASAAGEQSEAMAHATKRGRGQRSAKRSGPPKGTGTAGQLDRPANGNSILAHTHEPGPQRRDSGELQECSEQWAVGQGGSQTLANSISKRNEDNRPRSPHSEAGTVQGDRAERERVRTDPRQCDDDGGAYWLPEPELGRVANGIPSRAHRLRCLGNAIVPQVAQVFARAIHTTLKTSLTAKD